MSVNNASDILHILPMPVLNIFLSASSINGTSNQYLCNLLSAQSDDIVKSVLGNDSAYNPNLNSGNQQHQHQQQQQQQHHCEPSDSTETSPSSFIYNDAHLQSSISPLSSPTTTSSPYHISATVQAMVSSELLPNPASSSSQSTNNNNNENNNSTNNNNNNGVNNNNNNTIRSRLELIQLDFDRKSQIDMEIKNQRLFQQQQQQLHQRHQRMNLSSSTSSLSSTEDDDTDDDDCSVSSSSSSTTGGGIGSSNGGRHQSYNSYRRRSSHDIYGEEEDMEDDDDDSHLESIYQCIFESYTQQRIISQPVLLNNLSSQHQYSATLVVRPLSDGCCCFFQEISQPRTPSGLTIFNNQLRMLTSIPEDIQPTPYQGGFAKLFEHFDNLSAMFQSSPVIVWRTNSKGEMVYFKKMDDNRCQGRSLEEFLLWVHPSNRSELTDKFKTIQIEGASSLESPANIQQAFYFMTGMDSRDYLLYVLRGYKVQSNEQVGWVGVSFSFVMNEGAIVSVREEVSLESMFQRFKSVCEMPRGERLKLGIEDDFLSGESFSNLLKEKKLLMTEDEKKTFQRCRDTYNILFKLSLLGVMFSTLKGTIIDANDAFLSTFGYSRSDLENGHVDWMMMTPPEYYEISARALQELKSKRWCQPIEKAYFHRSGAKVPVLISAAMVDGTDEQCITFVFDLSRYRQAEESAIQANKLKSQFIANISHELRTPCHGILGMTQIILDSKELTPSQRDNAETIKKSTDNLVSLIDDILDFSKIESGKMTLDFSSFELVSMVEQVLHEHSKLSNAKAIDLVFIMGREYPVPPVLFGDRKRIKQILSNLVSNAVKFTEAGHVLIEISTEYESGDQISLKFSVQDTGIGIPHENASQLFVPFIQLDGSSSRKHGGSGLGLSIVKELVDLMGGTLSFESKKGQGSTFWFSLKLLIAAPNYLPSSVPPANQFFYPEFRQFNSEITKKVLVVEPNQKLRMSIHSILTAIKYESMESLRIENAIDIFRMAKKMDSPFDIIMVSDTSGFIKSLLDLVTNEKVYIYGRDSKSSWASHPKVTAYLMKPLRYTQVISTLLRDSSYVEKDR
ncbi:histidine kinase [Cavenderia fasciculata]|uniref:histidine kinase n=1 Tax=Cavenderia fasciculata TaxID=261658 RepID=F4PP44_CACFS|nr:histidine kinase [Cavenderia fasciculata]EGG22157.1 histidine kinase [Cavenderia fasciculata]|eukprot:XP_004360008.1 histidine kinase [Cavenderia fasciculata]